MTNELEKTATYSHTWLGLNPQLGDLSQGLSVLWFIFIFYFHIKF
jgi:hypothetical protein